MDDILLKMLKNTDIYIYILRYAAFHVFPQYMVIDKGFVTDRNAPCINFLVFNFFF